MGVPGATRLTCLQGHPSLNPGARFCVECGAALVPAAGPGEPTCATHPAARAAGACARCGTFACTACLAMVPDGEQWCAACRARMPQQPLPWDQRRELGVLRAWWRTTRQILFSPTATFEQATPHGTVGSSLLYALIALVFQVGSIVGVYVILFGGFAVAGLASRAAKPGEPGFFAIAVAVLAVVAILCILLGLGVLLIGAALDHVVLRLLGVKRGWEVTLRGAALSMAPSVCGVVPFCGAQVAFFWTFIVRVFAYRGLHQTTGGKAAAGALVVPGVMMMLLAAGYTALLLFATMATTK
jgi:hypothetical protein